VIHIIDETIFSFHDHNHNLLFFLSILWFLASIAAISGALAAVLLFLSRSTPSVLVALCLLLSYRQLELL
jgi:hypothetical protein